MPLALWAAAALPGKRCRQWRFLAAPAVVLLSGVIVPGMSAGILLATRHGVAERARRPSTACIACTRDIGIGAGVPVPAPDGGVCRRILAARLVAVARARSPGEPSLRIDSIQGCRREGLATP